MRVPDVCPGIVFWAVPCNWKDLLRGGGLGGVCGCLALWAFSILVERGARLVCGGTDFNDTI